MASVAKWYTFTEYYNEDGVQITKREAKNNYKVIGKSTITKIEGATGSKTIWYQCEKDKQLKLEL